jgi:hypothetical protein
MPNCTACKGAIEQEKDGNVCLPCGHTFHPICYLSSYNDNQDELPNDFIKLSKCVFCVLDATKIISDEPVDELFTDDDRQKYSMRHAQLICAHNKIYIKRIEVAEEVVKLLEERHKKSLKGFVKVARRYGSARWKLERLVHNKRSEIITEVQRIAQFTIKRMSEAAYKEITESELYKDFVIKDKEYVKSLNSLQYIDPIQYFNESISWFLTKNMSLNRYTRKLVRDNILAKSISTYNRSTIKGQLNIKIT